MEIRVAMMTVIVLVLVITCLSNFLYMVVKANCRGDDFGEDAEKNQSDTWDIGWE